MKQIILFLLVLIFSTQGMLSQEKELKTEKSPQELENNYTMKFKKKKKTAWILLGAGVGVMAIGAAVAAYSYPELNTAAVLGGGVFVVGVASVIASIPAFIKANYFKKKAEAASSSFQVSIGTISTPQRNNFALGVSYNF